MKKLIKTGFHTGGGGTPDALQYSGTRLDSALSTKFTKHTIFKKSFFIANAFGKFEKSNGFTLAEVLITLGIIGIVAAMTLPALVQNYQKTVLKNQFKKTYSSFYTAIRTAQTNLGYPVGCSYWTSGQKCSEVCTKRDPVYNSCQSFTCADGSPLPAEQNGPRGDCAAFDEELFTRVLKVVKFCENNALKNGCITEQYKGTDKIKEIQNPDAAYPPNPASDFSDSNIKNNYSSWVLSDGTIIIKYGTYKSTNFPIFTVDINGHKRPNKWGYDIFTFALKGDTVNGITKLEGSNYATEKGGLTTQQMIQQMYD